MPPVMFRKRLRRAIAQMVCALCLSGCVGGGTEGEAKPGPKPPASAPAPVIDDSTYAGLYPELWSVSDPGPVVPGLDTELVPQGLAFWPEKRWLLISGYMDNGAPSTLTIVDAETGAHLKTLTLHKEDGTAYTGHAGGVAISERHAWISSGGNAYWIPLSDLADAADGDSVRFAGRLVTPTRASFTTYAESILWVGEFHALPDYPTDPSHRLRNNEPSQYNAWVVGYRLDPETDLVPAGEQEGEAVPDYILSIADRIQGMAVTGDSILLSQSYGRTKNSALLKYPKPDLNGPPHQSVTLGGQGVPVWFLDRKNLAASLTLPPMSEGVISDGAGRLFILFESAAKKYRSSALSPMDRLRIVRLNAWK